MHKHALGILFVYAATLNAFAIAPAQADFASGTITTPTYETTCPDGMVASPTTTGTQAQKQDYCKAAAGATQGNTADSALWKVWSAVAGVCVASCASIAGNATPACPTAMTGGAATDSIVSKNYASSLQSIMSASTSGTAVQTATKNKVTAPCASAAMAAFTAITRNKSANQEASVASSNLSSAASLTDNTGAVKIGGGSGASAATAGGTISTLAGGATGSGMAGQSSAAFAGENPACTAARNTGSGQATLQCAISQDAALQPLATAAYQNSFNQATGQSLGSFLEKAGGSGGGGDSAASAIAGLAAGAMPGQGDAAVKAAGVLKQMQDDILGEMPSSLYASAPAAAKPAGDGDPDFNAVMGNVMAMFGQNGAKNPDAQNPRAGSLDFGQIQLSRSPASVAAEDPTISLFDRVSNRYTVLGRKLLTEGTFAE